MLINNAGALRSADRPDRGSPINPPAKRLNVYVERNRERACLPDVSRHAKYVERRPRHFGRAGVDVNSMINSVHRDYRTRVRTDAGSDFEHLFALEID